MTAIPWSYDDGGRAEAGYKGRAGDCVCRSVAIATGVPYQQVYDALWERVRAGPNYQSAKRHKTRSRISPRNGVPRAIYEPYLLGLGWVWTPTMAIGQGTTVHLRPDELPADRLVVVVSKHVTAVVNDGRMLSTGRRGRFQSTSQRLLVGAG